MWKYAVMRNVAKCSMESITNFEQNNEMDYTGVGYDKKKVSCTTFKENFCEYVRLCKHDKHPTLLQNILKSKYTVYHLIQDHLVECMTN